MTHLAIKSGLLCGPLSVPVALEAQSGGERFKQLTMQYLTPEQHRVADMAAPMASSGLYDPYSTMLRSPQMAESLLPLEGYLRSKTSLPHRLSGSTPEAETGKLVVLAGGSEADVAYAAPILDVLARKTVHVVPVGQGIVLKLVINGVMALGTAALAEGLAYGVEAGLDRDCATGVPAKQGRTASASRRRSYRAGPGGRAAWMPCCRSSTCAGCRCLVNLLVQRATSGRRWPRCWAATPRTFRRRWLRGCGANGRRTICAGSGATCRPGATCMSGPTASTCRPAWSRMPSARRRRRRGDMLVLIGATPEGKKELIGFQVGVRESAQNWRELLVDLKARGLIVAPELATGDGALGFWKALDEVSPTTRHQRCTLHKTVNVLDKLPKSVQPAAKSDLREVWSAPDRATAEAAIKTFADKYGAKYGKAVSCLVKDQDALLTFYDFPAEHWDHLRTSNPIESVFATVRHRTVRTKGALSQDTARLMVFKLVMAAAKTWRRLKGENQLPKVVQGVTFRNGVEVTITPAQNAA